MRVGIGLPNVIAGAPPRLSLEWARAADAGPFSSLAVHDRFAYPSLEALTVLAAAAAITERIRLAALVVIAPLRGSAALLAKQAVTVAALSGGRLTLGLGLGPRRDDYEAARVPFRGRGRLFDEQLDSLLPLLGDDIELVLGGQSDAGLRRMVRFAAGFCHNGGPPRVFRAAADRARAAWSDAGRPGRPRLWGLGYFALGEGAAELGQADLRHYYGFTGALAERIAGGLLTSEAAISEFCGGYAEAGCDELVLFPTVAELAQVERLGDVIAGLRAGARTGGGGGS